ncbi:MAG: hypothetical protein ACR2PB_12530 [Desulfocapsaceae bacterium]
MSKTDPFMRLWNFMELSEKQRIMRQFLNQHGDHFSKDDFVRFLALRYDGTNLDPKQRRDNLSSRDQRH